MAGEQLLRDLGEIYSRLFDHRPVLQGDISYMIKQFEEQREQREQERLQQAVQHALQVTETLIPNCQDMCIANLPHLDETVNKANNICKEILEDRNNKSREAWLADHRKARVKDWTDFMDVMTQRSEKVDMEHAVQLTRLEHYYEDLEKKLKVTQSPR